MALYHTGPMSRIASSGPIAFLAAAIGRFREDRSVQAAGALTFTTLLALVPLLTVVLWLSSTFPAFDKAIGALERAMVAQLLPDSAGSAYVTREIGLFADNAVRLGALGLGFLALVALILMLTVEDTLNRIFDVTGRRPLLRRLLVYSALIALGPMLIGASLSMTSTLVGASLGYLDLDAQARMILGLLPFALTCAALTLLYLVVPYRGVDAGHALLGGLFAAAVFELAKRGFALFITQFPTYTLIYGAFAAVPLFLLWVYVSWLVVLVGATLTAQLTATGGKA